MDVPNRLAYQWRLGLATMRLLRLYPKGSMHFFSTWELKRMVREAGLVPEKSLGHTLVPPFSGIYTSDLRRLTFLPRPVVAFLDRLYLAFEIRLRRLSPFKAICFHYVLEARKSAGA